MTLPSIALRRLLCALSLASLPLAAQQNPAPAPIRAVGTVQSISGNDIAFKTDSGSAYSLHVTDKTRLLQVAPGSKDLSAAHPFQLSDVASGDRILIAGNPADPSAPTSLTLLRIVLMKQLDIAALHADEMADWQKRGSGGLVKSVDATAQTISITSSGHPVTIQLQRNTILRRYAPDSVAFESAQPGTLAQIQPGDQLRVRGDRSTDGASISADEVVSGSFRNVAGPISAVDLTAGTITVKDLTSKHAILVHVTGESSLRVLSPMVATFIAQRMAAAAPSQNASPKSPTAPAPPTPPTQSGTGARPRMDLAQAMQRMPAATLKDFHTGDAVMLVASAADQTTTTVTAITVLGGVDAILSATPKGGKVMQLSPWNIGGDPTAGVGE